MNNMRMKNWFCFILLNTFVLFDNAKLKFLMEKVLRRNSDQEIVSHGDYLGEVAEREFQRMVFSPEAFTSVMTGHDVVSQSHKQQSPSVPVEPTPTIEELKDRKLTEMVSFAHLIVVVDIFQINQSMDPYEEKSCFLGLSWTKL